MKLMRVAVCFVLLSAVSHAHAEKQWITGGVNIASVDWGQLCPSIQPVQITREGVTCRVVHPASGVFRHPVTYFGATPQLTQASCDVCAEEFKKWTIDEAACRFAFERALGLRSREKYDDMAFEAWRAKYFGQYVNAGKENRK